MNRIATVRSRRMMLYTVCSVAVVLGAVGKSMIDGLSPPNINTDSAMVSDTASPALPASTSASTSTSASPSLAMNQQPAPAPVPVMPPPSLPLRQPSKAPSKAVATNTVPSVPIISRPSTNERSLADTQPCSSHSRDKACTRIHTKHRPNTQEATRTSHSAQQAAAHSTHARHEPKPATSPIPTVTVWVHNLVNDITPSEKTKSARAEHSASETKAARSHQLDHH